jgi:hypothetical protein
VTRSALRDRPAPKGIRRVERWLVGLVMAVLAYAVEKAVLRSVRKGETTPKPVEPTTISGTGTDLTAEL